MIELIKRWDFTLEGKVCPLCNGTGSTLSIPDCHNSEGWIPCPQQGTQSHGYPMCVDGKLKFSEYDIKHKKKLMKRYQ